MKLKDKEMYENWKAKNTDSYGAGIFRYAEKWANLMEVEIENGASVKDVAERLSHVADTEGITGYMYGASVSILLQCWEHGEDLKEWNKK